MKTSDTPRNYTMYNFSADAKAGKAGYCYTDNNNSNCKLTVLDYIGALISSGTQAEKKYRMDQVLSKCKLTVYINTPDPNVAEWLQKNYELYGMVQIPVGYGKNSARTNYQYHIHLRNTLTQYGNVEYMRPTKYKPVEVLQ